MTARWFQLQAALQSAGFACVTLAAAFGVQALLPGRPGGMEERALQWNRAGFLLLGGALVTGTLRTGTLWPQHAGQQWGLLSWLIFFAVLHVHRVPAFKGRTAVVAGLAGWVLTVGAWFGLR
jgi:ABC-type uncharacterized transport system permease subunit